VRSILDAKPLRIANPRKCLLLCPPPRAAVLARVTGRIEDDLSGLGGGRRRRSGGSAPRPGPTISVSTRSFSLAAAEVAGISLDSFDSSFSPSSLSPAAVPQQPRLVCPAALVADLPVIASALRLGNYLPSISLVAAGALAAGAEPTQLLSAPFLVAALCSAGVAFASCAVNDVFDAAGRVDAGKKGRALTGTEGRDGAQRLNYLRIAALASGLYAAVLALSLSLREPAAQGLVTASVALTLVYTPFCKPLVVLKNGTVAAVLAAAVLLGGVSLGGWAAAMQPTALAASGVVFLLAFAREIVMDVADAEGDARAGLITLPNLVGQGASLTLAGLLAATAGSIGVAGPVLGLVAGTTPAPVAVVGISCVLWTAGNLLGALSVADVGRTKALDAVIQSAAVAMAGALVGVLVGRGAW